jgi:hypothetical protein
MSALIAATGAFARVPSRHPSTFFSNISIPVQATTSMSLARSGENASGKVEELLRLVLQLLALEKVQRLVYLDTIMTAFVPVVAMRPTLSDPSNVRAG